MAAGVIAHVNLTSATAPFPHALWKSCLGSGHAQLGSRVDWRAHLTKAHSELGLTGVRMHGWLDDDMSVAPTPDKFHFYNIDLVADFLVSLDLKPIFELDYMPRSMTSCDEPSAKCYYAFHNRGGYKGLDEPPKDYDVWHTLIHSLGAHLLDRHGLPTLSKWRFEVWNEPNPWIGGVSYPAQYEPLYNASATALKAVHPSLRVGGPATATLAHLEDFATRCTWTQGTPLDFVSTHFYPSEHNCTDRHAPLGTDPDCFAKTVLNASMRLSTARAAAGAPPVPFALTEFNSGLQGGPGTGEAGPHSDTAYAAAYAIRTIPMLASARHTDGVTPAIALASWWTFSDLLDEGWLTGTPFYGGFGLLSSQGVAKPAYRAFQLLRDAGTRRLLDVGVIDPAPDFPHILGHSTVNVLATVDDDVVGEKATASAAPHARLTAHRGLQLFLSNFAPMAGATGAPWAAPKARNVTVTIRVGRADLPGGCKPPQRARLRRIDDTVTRPRGAWTAMGSPSYLSAKQLAALHAASEMSEETVALHKAAADPGVCACTLGPIELPAYGVAHVGDFE